MIQIFNMSKIEMLFQLDKILQLSNRVFKYKTIYFKNTIALPMPTYKCLRGNSCNACCIQYHKNVFYYERSRSALTCRIFISILVILNYFVCPGYRGKGHLPLVCFVSG